MIQRLAAGTRSARELAHDTTIRFTHELRMTLRELGSRRVAADVIDVVDDVFYLTCDELITTPADARLRIKRRAPNENACRHSARQTLSIMPGYPWSSGQHTSIRRQVRQRPLRINQPVNVDRVPGPDQALDVVHHVPDVDIHPG